MALMERVTRRGSFLDLGEMDQTEFETWWRAQRDDGAANGWMMLDCIESDGCIMDWVAVAYAEDWGGVIDATFWWDHEMDGDCSLRYYRWIAEDARWEYVPAHKLVMQSWRWDRKEGTI